MYLLIPYSRCVFHWSSVGDLANCPDAFLQYCLSTTSFSTLFVLKSITSPLKSVQNVSSPTKQGSIGFSIDTPVDPFPVVGRSRSLLFTSGVRTAVTKRPGEGFRNPCDFAAEAVLLGKLFPRDPLFLALFLPISEWLVVTEPVPVVEDTSKDVLLLAMALTASSIHLYTALITSERSKSTSEARYVADGF